MNGKKYDNLYTQDIICHGVPSPKVWNKYLEFHEKKYASSPVEINFRQKDDGWNSYKMSLKYSNNSYKCNNKDDLYMQAFLRDTSLRDSCYNCSFKSKNRQTDITLADFWGVIDVCPEFCDDKGTSLVIVNTEKGQELFNSLKEKMIWKETDFEESIKYNPSMFKSVKKPAKREEFFEKLDDIKFDELVKKYTIKPKRNIIKRAIRKILKVLK